jgi:DNA replication protein DnaC
MAELEELDDYAATCSTCDRNRYVIVPDGDVARAKICQSCFDVCPACDGEEYRFTRDERGYRFAEECTVCGTLRRRIEAFNDASIPARYHDRQSTLEYFETHDSHDNEIGNLPAIKMKLFRWVRGFVPEDQGFLLHGKVGTGKTHLLAAIIRQLTLEKGIRSRFIEFTHLLGELREQFDEGRGEGAILGPLSDIPVLAIDELGKGQNTEWQLSVIDQIISKRYNRGLTTLFTTNYPLDKPKSSGNNSSFTAKVTSETLRERIGERIFSRLHEMTEFVEIDAPDYRKR